jgi:hypothetical protein
MNATNPLNTPPVTPKSVKTAQFKLRASSDPVSNPKQIGHAQTSAGVKNIKRATTLMLRTNDMVCIGINLKFNESRALVFFE